MKRNIIAIGLVFAVLMSFASCKKLPQDNEFSVQTQVYVVDDEGVTHNVQSEYNIDGEQIYYYEDYQGNRVTVANKDVVIQTTKVRKTTSVYEGAELTPEEESFLNTFNDPDALDNLVDESITVPELEISDDLIPEDNFEEIKVEVDSDGNPKHEDIEKRYTDIVESGKFTIDFVIKGNNNGQDMVVPLRVVRDDDKMYFETAMPVNGEGAMKMAFLMRDKTCYLIIPGMRAYMTMPADEIANIFDTNMVQSDGSANYVSTSEVEYNGKKYICDEYESKGTVIKYYYADNEIKRIESTDPEGGVSIMEINEISDKVDSSKFKVPSGYIDMTKFLGQEFASSFSGVVPTTKQ